MEKNFFAKTDYPEVVLIAVYVWGKRDKDLLPSKK